MKKLLLLAVAALSGVATAETSTQPPKKIDVSQLPKQAQMIDEVVVPVPSEIFAVLDKQGKPHWAAVLRPSDGVVQAPGGAEHTSLLLGAVIAEGFIAVEAENAEEVKNIGRSVLNLSKAIGVEKAVKRRSQSIIDAAEDKDWTKVRRELDGARADVEEAMTMINSRELSELVSLGGWLRGTEALTTVVLDKFSKEGAELLHQSVMLDYFQRRIEHMPPRRQKNTLVVSVKNGLKDVRPLMGVAEGVEISEKTVREIGVIAQRLIKEITTKSK